MVSIKNRQEIFVFLRAQLSAQFATLADFVLTYICFVWVNLHYLPATIVGTVSGGFINCLVNYKWAFATQDCQFKWVLVKYILVWTGSFLLNVGGLYWVVESLKKYSGLWESDESLCLMICKIVVSVIVSIGWNFVLHRYFVFKDAHIQSKLNHFFK